MDIHVKLVQNHVQKILFYFKMDQMVKFHIVNFVETNVMTVLSQLQMVVNHVSSIVQPVMKDMITSVQDVLHLVMTDGP